MDLLCIRQSLRQKHHRFNQDHIRLTQCHYRIDAFKTGSSGSGTITVTERTHGRSSSDTVRFRDVNSFDGITKANLENSSGYSITKVDDDTYTFSVSTDTATTGNIRGGGDRATAGPATIEN